MKTIVKLAMIMVCILLTACKDEQGVENSQNTTEKPQNSRNGWYVRANTKIATTSDFDEINIAIRDNERLNQYYYAEYSAFFDEDGYWVDWRNFEKNFDSGFDAIYINGNKISSYYCYLGNNTVEEKNIIHSLYAGRELGTLYYYDSYLNYNLSYEIKSKKIITIDQQHIFSYEENHLYEITNGGTEYIKYKFNP